MNKRMKFLLMTIFLTLAIGVSACSSKPTPTPIAYYIETSVAATMQFQATLDSLRALEQQMTQMAMPTATPQPTWTPMPSPTIAQTQSLLPAAPAAPAAPVATQPPAVLPPAAPAATPTSASLCLKASLVSETIPDGTAKAANEAFTKSWTFKNVGTCAWTTEFDFAFVSGEKMGGANIDMKQSVAPGGEITISVPMTAPGSAGDYTGWWSFLDQGGNRFGVGNAGTGHVSVRIVVK